MRVRLQYMLLCAIALFAVGTTPSYAQQADLLLRTAATCQTIPAELSGLVDRLEKLRWRPVLNTELPPTAINGNAAIQLAENLGFGEAPKVKWTTGWAFAKKNADGLKNLTSLTEEIGVRHFFVSAEGSFLQTKFKKKFWLTQITCDMALVSADMDQVLTDIEVSLRRAMSTPPPIARLGVHKSKDEQASRSFNLTLTNADEVSGLIDAPFVFTGIASIFTLTNPPSR